MKVARIQIRDMAAAISGALSLSLSLPLNECIIIIIITVPPATALHLGLVGSWVVAVAVAEVAVEGTQSSQ